MDACDQELVRDTKHLLSCLSSLHSGSHSHKNTAKYKAIILIKMTLISSPKEKLNVLNSSARQIAVSNASSLKSTGENNSAPHGKWDKHPPH
jgi:hypothetical protein